MRRLHRPCRRRADAVVLAAGIGGGRDQGDDPCRARHAIGLRDHISEVLSYEKLTGEGMTFVKSRLTTVIEEYLPGQFGGSSLDYLLLEEEDPDGIVRVYLLVSPMLGPLVEAALKKIQGAK